MGVIVDGTPFALIVPHLFIENFQSIDDYSNRPFYALFLRALKFISFAISMLLPGIYVAVAIFHQELLPASMLFDIAVSESCKQKSIEKTKKVPQSLRDRKWA